MPVQYPAGLAQTTPPLAAIFFPEHMNSQPLLITQMGLDQLKSELDELNSDRRPNLVVRLSQARSMGDLSENSDYQSAREDLAFVDGRIAELEDLIKSAQVSHPSSNSQVNFGHKVTVKVNGGQTVFHIVGEWEADPAQKKISHSSPLGKALMGKKVGETAQVEAPAGKVLYKVTHIE